jgi:hypothetical protein
VLVIYDQLQLSVLARSIGDYLGMLMFDNFGMQKYIFANLNFQTLWPRSSEEWEFVMGTSVHKGCEFGRVGLLLNEVHVSKPVVVSAQ